MADRMTRLVVDSPSLFYRAFFAVPKSIKGPAGNSVNAVRGYLDMVSRVIVDRRPEAVANVFDADWRPQWRVDLYAGYKAKRAEDPPELPGQVPLLLEVLDAAGLPVAEAAGYEADDVIGTIAAAAGPEERLAVLTGDRDLFQVVRDPVVWVLYPLRGTSSLATMDGAGVRAKAGVPAERYVDLAILRGDPSDGLPGVPGIGEKTAAGLIADHPDLDALLAAAAEGRLSPRLNAALTASADYIEAMRKVAAVATDVDYRISSPHPPDRDRLAAVAADNAIEGPVERMLQAVAGGAVDDHHALGGQVADQHPGDPEGQVDPGGQLGHGQELPAGQGDRAVLEAEPGRRVGGDCGPADQVLDGQVGAGGLGPTLGHGVRPQERARVGLVAAGHRPVPPGRTRWLSGRAIVGPRPR
jgi:5'-3' exonuclease